MDSVIGITLITQTYASDSIGQRVPTNVEKTVIGFKSSVTGQEINEASQRGIRPQFRVEVWTAEYNGAELVKVGNTTYSVYRTFDNNNGKTELYLEERTQ